MNDIDALILHEAANSSLAFRSRVYRSGERDELLRDLLALANASAPGARMLILGVEDTASSGGRRIHGVDPAVVPRLRDVLPRLADRTIEPPIKVAVSNHSIEGKEIVIVTLTECSNRPYLLKHDVSQAMRAGCGWIRRGTSTAPLLRDDLDDMFRARYAAQTTTDVRVVFAGDPPGLEREIPPLPLTGLPSIVASDRLKKLLEARASAKAVLGRTQTQFNRLLHAQLFDADHVYEEHSDESLRASLDKIELRYEEADAHYTYELRAHPVQLVISNVGEEPLQSGVLELSVPVLAGLGVAERLYGPCGHDTFGTAPYPTVIPGPHATKVQSSFAPIAPGASVAAFRVPPRIWAREEAAGKTIELRCTVHSASLHAPRSDTLRLHIGRLR